MLSFNKPPEGSEKITGYTLEIRSLDGELCFLRSFPVAKAKSIAREIMSAKSFWSERWTLIIRPFNEKTDAEGIGSLKFLSDL